MEFNPEIIEYLTTPVSWLIYEILALFLFLIVIVDAMKRNDDDNERIIRVFEIVGFVFYAVIFENLGVIGTTYDYSLHRFMIFGVVPLSIPMFEASIFYVSLLFAEKLDFPKWSRPFVVAFLGMLQDFTLDPVSIADSRLFNGVTESRWNWQFHYADTFYGIPYFNFSGWFVLMFYYTVLILVGRNYFEKSNNKLKIGFLYITISIILGDLLILSPLTLFLLFAWPFAIKFKNRTAEIIMLLLISMMLVVILAKTGKREKISFKENKIIWIVPLSIHLIDIIITIILGFTYIFVPVFLFSIIHILYIGYYMSKK